MARPLWFVALLKKTFPNTHIIARMTRIPLLGRAIDKMLFDGDDIIYLPKDSAVTRTVSVGKTLERPEEAVLPSEIVHRFIDKANYHWIMNFCICRESSKCKDYPIDYGCLFLGEAAMGINPNLGRRVTKEEAHEYIRKCDEAGLVHLIGRNKLDSVWLNVGPGHKLLTICNCCPCCCLWRVLPVISPEIGDKITRMPGISIEVNDNCVGCGTCTAGVCFVDAIRLVDGRAVISNACRGCGRCVDVCPEGAITLTIADPDAIERAVGRVSAVVDVE
ncbi:MAG: 4Fe-4S binding protein [Candidatus Thorarchaeota archaeon]|nr:4Fe-4S binding protein [Candidatus Thorarchaeota archaeon]